MITMATANFLKTVVIALTAVAFPTTALLSPFVPESAGPRASCHHAAKPSGDVAHAALSDFNVRITSISHRRSFLRGLSEMVTFGSSLAVLSLPSVARAEAESMERGGVKLTPFNSLSFNYRGTVLCILFLRRSVQRIVHFQR